MNGTQSDTSGCGCYEYAIARLGATHRDQRVIRRLRIDEQARCVGCRNGLRTCHCEAFFHSHPLGIAAVCLATTNHTISGFEASDVFADRNDVADQFDTGRKRCRRCGRMSATAPHRVDKVDADGFGFDHDLTRNEFRIREFLPLHDVR